MVYLSRVYGNIRSILISATNPAKIRIAVSIYELEMIPSYSRNSTKYLLIWQGVFKSIDRDGHVPRPEWTVVKVPVVFRY